MEPSISFLTYIRHLLAPPQCEACNRPIAVSPGLCRECQVSLRLLRGSHCTVCAIPFISEDLPSHPCGNCIRVPPRFRKVWAAYIYGGAVVPLMHQAKFGNRLDGLRILCRGVREKFSEALLDFQPDLLIPMPLNNWRQFRRGYNQSYLLLRFLQKITGDSTPVHWKLRRKYSSPQAMKDRKRRVRDLRRAFIIQDPPAIVGRKILVVDDVLTTGATANALAGALLKAGAAEVGVFVLARVQRKNPV